MKFITTIENDVDIFIDEVVYLLKIHRLMSGKFGSEH